MQLTHTRTTMSSREIANLTGKQHKNVLSDVRHMLQELKLTLADFSADLPDDYGRLQPAFTLTRELTETLLTGYSIPMRHKVIMRWRELEAAVGQVLTPDQDPRLTKIAYAMSAGLIDQGEANRRAQAILDEFAPIRAADQGAPRRIMIGSSVSKPLERSGRPLSFGTRHKFYLHDLGDWVVGGDVALRQAMISTGLMTDQGRSTAKGRRFFAYERGGREPMVFASELLSELCR